MEMTKLIGDRKTDKAQVFHTWMFIRIFMKHYLAPTLLLAESSIDSDKFHISFQNFQTKCQISEINFC